MEPFPLPCLRSLLGLRLFPESRTRVKFTGGAVDGIYHTRNWHCHKRRSSKLVLISLGRSLAFFRWQQSVDLMYGSSGLNKLSMGKKLATEATSVGANRQWGLVPWESNIVTALACLLYMQCHLVLYVSHVLYYLTPDIATKTSRPAFFYVRENVRNMAVLYMGNIYHCSLFAIGPVYFILERICAI